MKNAKLSTRLVSMALALALACSVCPLAALTAAPETAYADTVNFVSEPGSQIGVTAPFWVDFGSQTAPYDVANPNSEQSKAALTSTSYFINTGKTALALDELSCVVPDAWNTDNTENHWLIGTDGTSLNGSQNLFTFKTNDADGADAELTFGYATNSENALTRYDETIKSRIEFDSDETLDCTYTLNLNAANAQVNSAAANGAKERQSIGTVTFTFDTSCLTGSLTSQVADITIGTTAKGLTKAYDESLCMVLADASTGNLWSGQVYDASQIKEHALDLSIHQNDDGTNDSIYYEMYSNYIADASDATKTSVYDLYVCWLTVKYGLRVIGIGQDLLSSSSAYGTLYNLTYAGLTFMALDSFAFSSYSTNDDCIMNTTGLTADGWEKSSLRTALISYMNNGTKLKDYTVAVNKVSRVTWWSETDDEGTTYKKYGSDNSLGNSCSTSDTIFLLSRYEVYGSTNTHPYGVDGYFQYQWFEQNLNKASDGGTSHGAQSLLIHSTRDIESTTITNAKGESKTTLADVNWWLRSVGESDINCWKYINNNGVFTTGLPASAASCNVAAFCW